MPRLSALNNHAKIMRIEYRVARMPDISALEELIPLSARKLQCSYYTREQIDGAIGTVFGVDTQLIKDGTYFVAVVEGQIVGCGGWSKRKTLYGGDKVRIIEDPLRDPSTEPAMIRAFFVHPNFVRHGIGREFMRLSETASFASGFRGIDIVATLAGEPLYASCGYAVVERFDLTLINGALMPVVRMKRKEAPNLLQEAGDSDAANKKPVTREASPAASKP
jgi:hypothetical protein